MVSKTEIEIDGRKCAVFSYARLKALGEERGEVIVNLCAQDRATGAVGHLGQAVMEFESLEALQHLIDHVNDNVKALFPSVTIPEKRIVAVPAGFKA